MKRWALWLLLGTSLPAGWAADATPAKNSINEEVKNAFKNNPAGYVRTDLSKYGSLRNFLNYARKLPWMDEGWQSPEIFLSHMKT